MYPPSAGGGLLRLHSTYRHDLKIYSSGAACCLQQCPLAPLALPPCDSSLPTQDPPVHALAAVLLSA